MRPPMQSAALQHNEASRHHHSQQQQQQPQVQQQQQQQLQQFHTTSPTVVSTAADLPNQSGRKSKLQQRDILVENHLNFVCNSASTVKTAVERTPAYQQQPQQQEFSHSRSNFQVHSGNLNDYDDDSIQLVDLSTSPPAQQASFAHHHPVVVPRSCAPPHTFTQRSSIISDCQQFSRSSSSDDGSLSGDRLLHYTRAHTFDDAAENFIINFPADSPSHNQNDCIINLPLSETEPLLTNIEATVSDTKRAICLSKNSASLIFTKKDIPQHNNATTAALRYYTPATKAPAISNNNCPSSHKRGVVNNACSIGSVHSTTASVPSITSRRHQHQHQSLRSSNERTNRKHSKHLPATYQQQQRRSLQLNYNNNLVTTSTCNANNNYCCSTLGLSATTVKGGAVLHKHHSSGLTSPVASNTTAAAARKQHAYSWYAPVYSALEEELEQDSRDSSPIHNLANTKKHHTNHYQLRSSHNASSAADNETVALLETRNQINIQAQLHAQTNSGHLLHQPRRSHSTAPTSLPLRNPHNARSNSDGGGSVSDFSSSVSALNSYDVEGPHAGSLGLAGGPLPPRRRFENFFKSLFRTASSRNGTTGSEHATPTPTQPPTSPQLPLPASPEIKITRTPSEQNMVVMRDPAGRCNLQEHHQMQHGDSGKLANGNSRSSNQGSTSSLNVVQQKLWNMMRREGSAASLYQEKSQSIVQYTGLRKCETVLALTRQTHSLCSPVLGMGPGIVGGSAAGGMNVSGSGVFSASGVEQIRPLNRLRNSMTSVNAATCSRCSSLLSLAASGSRYSLNIASNGGVGGFVNTVPSSSVSQHQLQALLPPSSAYFHQQHYHQQQQQHHHHQHQQRNSSFLSSSNLSCSYNRSSGDDVYDNGAALGPNVVAPPHSSSGNCSRNSSTGANSSHSTTQSISPPSNVTTATLNSSSITPPSHTTATSTPTAITDADIVTPTSLPQIEVCADILVRPLSQAHAITVTSLLSMSSDEEERNGGGDDVIDGDPSCSSTKALNHLIKHQQQQQQQQQQQTSMPSQHHQQQQIQQQSAALPFQIITCKLCLGDVECSSEATTLLLCSCQFCTECMKAYVEFEISEGAYEISCPDAQCPAQGIITLPEIANLTTANLMKKHHRYRLNREIELDKSRTWCPRAGCETVCLVGSASDPHSDSAPSTSTSQSAAVSATASPVSGDGVAALPSQLLCAVQCPSCKDEFCSACKKTWHPNISCEENGRRLVADGQDDIGIPFDNDLIKCCPMCAVPIEKDEGCAQMMCKRCKHVFCWYCLASLDDDFLLRHYDKGPCKNKLGHSRASVVWHRAQVIGIFAGFGILLLVASPLLLLAAPCIICCKCRSCTGSKIDEGDGELDEAAALQS